MTRKLFLVLILIMYVAACAKQDTGPEQKTARGLMKHYPSNVRSTQSWQGHKFIVGDTPVIPTPSVPEAELNKYIGKSVVVLGVWHEGQKWYPSEEEKDFPAPVKPDNQIVIRGDGLKVSSIEIVEEQ